MRARQGCSFFSLRGKSNQDSEPPHLILKNSSNPPNGRKFPSLVSPNHFYTPFSPFPILIICTIYSFYINNMFPPTWARLKTFCSFRLLFLEKFWVEQMSEWVNPSNLLPVSGKTCQVLLNRAKPGEKSFKTQAGANLLIQLLKPFH